MRKIWDFHGGIHPAEHKTESNASAIEPAGIPDKLILPLQQHIGQPAKPVVSVGEQVLKGQLIAEPQGFVSVGVHAPTSGTIAAIIDHSIAHPSDLRDKCIIIEPDGQDTWCNLQPCENYRQLKPKEILQKIRAAGIAGMGGAGFPTEIKLHPPKEDKVQTLILNAAECEPYITADDRLMRERADDVIKGLEIMAYVLAPSECLIGIEDNKPEAAEALRRAAEGTQIEIVVIPTKYPSGGEKQLIKILTGKEVPAGHIPADIGVMCQNVGTAAAVYRAIRFGEPLISRITTVTGDCTRRRGNAEVLIGTPISWLLSQFEYNSDKRNRVIMGGPMMGFALGDLSSPIVKTTNCLLTASEKEIPLPPPAQACIRCGLCAEACPAELLPQQLYWFSRAEEFDKAEHHNLFDCIECGACSYVCPSTIPLVQYYRFAKGSIRQAKEDQRKSDQARERFEARQARIEREKEEKEAKRKARAEAAAKAQAEKKAAASNKPKPAETAQATEKTPATPASSQPLDLEALNKKRIRAQDKYEKMVEALDKARSENSDRVDALQKAVDSSKAALDKVLSEINAAGGSQQQSPSVDIDTLRTNLEKAQIKLDKMNEALAAAKANQPENVEKFERAAEKNQVRVAAAQKALDDALAAEQSKQSNAAPLDADALEQLQRKVLRAEDKYQKMLDALNKAQSDNPDRVPALQTAVDKSLTALENLKKQLPVQES